MSAVSTEHIVITPGTCGGKPRIAGTRIRVQDVVLWHEQMGMNADVIAATYTHLTLADVYAALTYYHDHTEEIRSALREADALFDALKSQQPSILDPLATRPDVGR